MLDACLIAAQWHYQVPFETIVHPYLQFEIQVYNFKKRQV